MSAFRTRGSPLKPGTRVLLSSYFSRLLTLASCYYRHTRKYHGVHVIFCVVSWLVILYSVLDTWTWKQQAVQNFNATSVIVVSARMNQSSAIPQRTAELAAVYSHFFVFLLWACSRQVRCVDIAVCGKDTLIRRRSVAAVTCRRRRRIGYMISTRRLDHGEYHVLMPEFRECKERFDTQFRLFLAMSANWTSVERWKGNAASSRRCTSAPRLSDRSHSLPLACIPLTRILQTQNVGTLSPGKGGIRRKQIIKNWWYISFWRSFFHVDPSRFLTCTVITFLQKPRKNRYRKISVNQMGTTYCF